MIIAKELVDKIHCYFCVNFAATTSTNLFPILTEMHSSLEACLNVWREVNQRNYIKIELV